MEKKAVNQCFGDNNDDGEPYLFMVAAKLLSISPPWRRILSRFSLEERFFQACLESKEKHFWSGEKHWESCWIHSRGERVSRNYFVMPDFLQICSSSYGKPNMLVKPMTFGTLLWDMRHSVLAKLISCFEVDSFLERCWEEVREKQNTQLPKFSFFLKCNGNRVGFLGLERTK